MTNCNMCRRRWPMLSDRRTSARGRRSLDARLTMTLEREQIIAPSMDISHPALVGAVEPHPPADQPPTIAPSMPRSIVTMKPP